MAIRYDSRTTIFSPAGKLIIKENKNILFFFKLKFYNILFINFIK